ncbi:MAG: preprotein translocase subunit SecG [Rubripirellula sp.]
MMILPLASLAGVLLGWLMAFLSLFLIMLILIQRGKGGGLTGALGGPGGQSAFGSKAGDTFTAITIVVASLWGLTCVITMLVLGDGGSSSATAASAANVQDAGIDTEDGGLGGASMGGDASSDDSDGFVAKTDQEEDVEADSTTPSADLAPAESDSSESDPVETEPSEEADESADSSAAAEESE